MNVVRLTSIAAIFFTATWVSFADRVEASDWGCEVLLCASSSNPSWHGVPACHPPMSRLMSAMSDWGFKWPTCPEAGTGKPGYERYAECPAGWSIGYSTHGHGDSREANLCIQVHDNCDFRGREHEGCQETISMGRPIRDEPYYFDIPDEDGQVMRHWFRLDR